MIDLTEMREKIIRVGVGSDGVDADDVPAMLDDADMRIVALQSELDARSDVAKARGGHIKQLMTEIRDLKFQLAQVQVLKDHAVTFAKLAQHDGGTMSEDSTPDVLSTEKRAMTGSRTDVLRVVSALRKYREASVALLANRYRDGEVDAVTLNRFYLDITEIDEELADEP